MLMKTKYLIPFAVLSLTLIGCSGIMQENCACLPATTRKEGEYRLNVQAASKDICPNAPKEGYYKPGFKFSFKILCVTDVSFYPYLDETRIQAVKEANTLGEYAIYEFEMPERDCLLTITGDQFFYDREYSFYEIDPCIGCIKPEDVIKVSIEEGAISNDSQVAEPVVTYSEDREDIEHNVSIIVNPYFVKTENRFDNKEYVKVTFYFKNNASRDITFEDNTYLYRDFSNAQRFTFKEGAPRFEIKNPITGDNR